MPRYDAWRTPISSSGGNMFSPATLGALAGPVMGLLGGGGGGDVTVHQNVSQSQAIQFNPSISVSSPASDLNRNDNFNPSHVASVDETPAYKNLMGLGSPYQSTSPAYDTMGVDGVVDTNTLTGYIPYIALVALGVGVWYFLK